MPSKGDYYIKDGRKRFNPSMPNLNRQLLRMENFTFINEYNRSENIFPKINLASKYFRKEMPKLHKYGVLN